MLYSSVTISNFFFSKQLSYFVPIFVNLSTEKHLHCQRIVAFEKKDLKIKAERRRNHWRQKRVLFQKTFWTCPRKTRKFRRYAFFLCLVNEISRQSFPNKYRSVETKFILSKEILKDRKRICFLFVDWANWKFFFLWKKCFVSQSFFLAFKKNASNCIIASQKNKSKSNNMTNFVWVQN